ncbi:hypothetical protein C0995_016212 [Termitomyces sp. Mi166|nr:hypothetical protein C0995_016212 [Termitomyces sp. Mi166\
MGGFQIGEPYDMDPMTLHPDDICLYLENHDIVISKEEIMDKSKGDILTKCLVLVQVTWFILQVLARAIQHLAISELEIVTLAFALLNLVIYFCWWNKPLDVNYPIQIVAYHRTIPHRMTMFGSLYSISIHTLQLETSFRYEPDQVDLSISDGIPVPIDPGDSPSSYSEVFLEQHPLLEHAMTIANQVLEPGHESPCAHLQPSPNPPPTLPLPERAVLHGEDTPSASNLHAHITTERRLTCGKIHLTSTLSALKVLRSWVKRLLQPIFSALCHAYAFLWYAVLTIAKGFSAGVTVLTREFMRIVNPGRVPGNESYLFGNLTKTESLTSGYIAGVLAVTFGATHCLAWDFEFASKSEQFLWCTSSIIITCLPIYGVMTPHIITLLR